MTIGTATLVAATMRASVDTKLELKLLTNTGNKVIQLRAGQWTRVFWWETGTTAGAQDFIISPQDSAGATVDFCRWQVVTGTDGPTLRKQVNTALRGGYNAALDDVYTTPATVQGKALVAALVFGS